MEKLQPTQMLKFYADCKELNITNKQHNYRTHDVSHSIDILKKFIAKGYTFRAAWHHSGNGRQVNLKVILPSLDGDLTGIYSNQKKIDEQLDKKQNLK